MNSIYQYVLFVKSYVQKENFTRVSVMWLPVNAVYVVVLFAFGRISTEGDGGKPWVSDFNDPNYIAGRKAMKTGRNYDTKGCLTAGFS